jgi:hypothetical protein
VIFFLGTNQPCHLGRTDAPLLLNRNRLARFRPVRRALGPWFLDSGGYTLLRRFGSYPVSPTQYVWEARRWSHMTGRPAHVSCQDWLCEPDVIVRTGLTVEQHLYRTVASYLTLRDLAPELPWLPVLQGWQHKDYLRCLELYENANVDLTRAPLVGLGSVCMRQGTAEAEVIIRDLHARGLRLHAFGFKITGLATCSRFLASSDSANWSNAARWAPSLPGHTHRVCNTCLEYALLWRQRVLEVIKRGEQGVSQAYLF